MKAPRETDLVKSCLQWLQHAGFMAWRNNTGGMRVRDRFYKFGDKGSPDILAVRDGVPLAVECKMPGNKQSDFQTTWADNWRRHGGVYLLVHSLDELIEGLKTLEA